MMLSRSAPCAQTKNHNVITFPIQYEKMKKPKPPMIGTVPPLLATPYPGTLQLTTV